MILAADCRGYSRIMGGTRGKCPPSTHQRRLDPLARPNANAVHRQELDDPGVAVADRGFLFGCRATERLPLRLGRSSPDLTRFITGGW